MCRAARADERGFTLAETLTACAVFATLTALAIPSALAALDEHRTGAAARYLAARCRLARMQAVRRSAAVALRFERAGAEVRFASFVDGNGNGVRTADIAKGVDRPVTGYERIGDQFAGVRFGLHEALPAISGDASASREPLQIGRSGILTFTPNGTATSGTLYLRGRGMVQYAVRILGGTGRTRVLRYDVGSRRWIEP
jgi:type II secretory pathway pseudopilin PulG